MNLETAANLGEALSGLAIMFTLLFGLRQMMEVNRNRRFEISQTIATSLENPLVQRGFATFGTVVTKDSTLEELMGLTREQKDSTNAVVVLMANHAVMTFNRNLSFEIVYSFYKGYLSLIGPSLRRMMQMVEFGYAMHELSSITKEEGMGTFHWVIWLLDRLEAHDDKTQFKPHLHQKDWVP
ncbi:MAG TPA: hypothetical protein D7H88_03075 [Candidatus Poseidoniales archaeon]|jgi:hypothetical protein|nr:MAG TPA: hypothetical protein D7H88_03075 [Candidatus Poseidoniales archaeon]HII20182.1 hypothetical protein [Poseidonia sp.]|tara:strand:+ start:457 stop:1002 length:546 start_codon:yes stop_codon:yes gene_type:complete